MQLSWDFVYYSIKKKEMSKKKKDNEIFDEKKFIVKKRGDVVQVTYEEKIAIGSNLPDAMKNFIQKYGQKN